jgi:hypothetical protein
MAQVNEGDWVEGEVKWWWKYVFPAKAQFWQLLAVIKAEPHPDPWFQAFSGQVQEALAMVNASTSIMDKEAGARLKHEGVEKIAKALSSVRNATVA